MRTLLRRLWLWLPAIGYMALIYYLSAQTDPMPSVTSVVWDKALHFLEYAGLATLLARALIGEGLRPGQAFAFAIVLACLYAGSDEWHQSGVASRDADARDWLADLLGSSAGAAAFVLFARFSPWPIVRPVAPGVADR